MISSAAKVSLIIIGLSVSGYASASVDSSLNSFFKGLGYMSNTTTPSAYQGQAAGYYGGGSMFLRSQVSNYSLYSLEWPSFSGGCSGIDAFTGSFSVMGSDDLKKLVKNILSNGGMYAFDLALTTVTPQLKSVKDFLQEYIGKINQSNINSCETAQDLVGGVFPKLQGSSQKICRDIASHTGPASDWASARQDCGTGGKFDETIANGSSMSSQLMVNKNIVWDALQKNGLTKNDSELAEMLMSLSGTVIVTNKNDKPHQVKPSSKVNSENLIKALLSGGKAKIYACDETEKCLNVTEKDLVISEKHSLVSLITSMVQTLNTEVASDAGELSESTRGFLEMTPVPILKYITTSLSLGRAVNPSEFSSIMAVTLLNQYLSASIRSVQEALRQEEDTPMDAEMATQIAEAQKSVANRVANAYRKLVDINVLVNNMKSDESQLVARLSSQASVGQETN